jgi:hypothetical protein
MKMSGSLRYFGMTVTVLWFSSTPTWGAGNDVFHVFNNTPYTNLDDSGFETIAIAYGNEVNGMT